MVRISTVPSEVDISTMMRMLDLLNSISMKPCAPELVAKLPLSELMRKTDILREALLNAKTSERDRINIYIFLIQVANMRGEAAEILTEELIPITCMDMMEAEKKGYHLLKESAMKFVLYLSKIFYELVISELQFHLKPQAPPPCSVLHAIALIASKDPNVSIRHVKRILPTIATLAEFAQDAPSREAIAQVVLQFIQIANNYLVQRPSEHGQFADRFFQFYNIFTGCMESASDEIKGVLRQALAIRMFLLDDFLGKKAEARVGQQLDHNQREEQAVDTNEMQRDICSRVLSLVTQAPESIQEILNAFLPLLESTNASVTLVLMTFYTEILNYQDLIEDKLTKHIIEKMASKIKPQDEASHCLAVRAIGNAAGKALKLDKAHSHYLLQILMEAITVDNTNVMTEGLKSLSRMVIFMDKKLLGKTFENLVTKCVILMSHKDAAIQMHSTTLLGQLTRRSREYSSKRFREDIINCLHLVLWKVHSKNTQCASSAMFTLHQMLPLLGCATDLIYQELAKRSQHVLKYLLFKSVSLINTTAEVCAVLEHIMCVTENLEYKRLSSTDLTTLWFILAEISKSRVPSMRQAAKSAAAILANKWKSLGTAVLEGWQLSYQIEEEVEGMHLAYKVNKRSWQSIAGGCFTRSINNAKGRGQAAGIQGQ